MQMSFHQADKERKRSGPPQALEDDFGCSKALERRLDCANEGMMSKAKFKKKKHKSGSNGALGLLRQPLEDGLADLGQEDSEHAVDGAVARKRKLKTRRKAECNGELGSPLKVLEDDFGWLEEAERRSDCANEGKKEKCKSESNGALGLSGQALEGSLVDQGEEDTEREVDRGVARKRKEKKPRKAKCNSVSESPLQTLEDALRDAVELRTEPTSDKYLIRNKEKKHKRSERNGLSGQKLEGNLAEQGDGCTLPKADLIMGGKEKLTKGRNAHTTGDLALGYDTPDFDHKEFDTGPITDLDMSTKKKKKKRKTTEANGSLGLEAYQNGNSKHHETIASGNKNDDRQKVVKVVCWSSTSRDNHQVEHRNNFQPSRAAPASTQEKSDETKSPSQALASSHTREDGNSQVKVFGLGSQDEKVRPLMSFGEVDVPESVLNCCKGFERPSPIQAHAWPFLLDGRDLIGIAATGSGKTLAFGLPALVHVLKRSETKRSTKYPTCLVLCPTRELAQQSSEVLVEAGRPCGVGTACLYGGTSKHPQISALKTGVAVVVATPGRLQDLVEGGFCSLHDISYLVLDEADRMLDLGFEDAVRGLVSQTSKSRQTLMFSATWPLAVDSLCKEFLRGNPIKVVVGSEDLAANHAVTQIVEVIEHTARDARLNELLKEYHKSARNRILVFVLYKKEAVRVESVLQKKGWKVCAVHGDKGQYDRNKAVTSFKDGSFPLMIATDVAARGLDIPDVEYVINYSFPLTTEDYVHRIGRTGRAGKSGIAHTFFTQADKARAGELINVLKEAGQTVPNELLKFGTSVKKKESKLYGAHYKEVAADAPKATKITFNSDED